MGGSIIDTATLSASDLHLIVRRQAMQNIPSVLIETNDGQVASHLNWHLCLHVNDYAPQILNP